MKKVFVSVGTTKFDKLINAVSKDDILDLLYSMGYTSVQFQVGTGSCEGKTHPQVNLKYNKYFEDFGQQIDNSDLVISHAGAGTCLEVLKKHKPLIVVINEDLMDNHQIELANQLEKDGYLKCCTPKSLKSVLEESKIGEFNLYPEPEPDLFSKYLDKCMGFS